MPGRIAGARQTLARYEQSDPHMAGQVRAGIGGVLVADGLVGLENPFDGRKRRPGILGSLFGIVLSVLFLLLVLWMRSAFSDSGAGGLTDDPAFDDPFFDSGSAGPSGADTSRLFDIAFTVMIVIACLLLLAAVVTFLVRLASIVFGVVLLRSGRRMAAAHPATAGDSGLVEEARTQLSTLLAGSRPPGYAERRRDRLGHSALSDEPDSFDRFNQP